MGMRVRSVIEAAESGAQPIHPMVLGRVAMEAVSTPVQARTGAGARERDGCVLPRAGERQLP
jgi:hypothetical protein